MRFFDRLRGRRPDPPPGGVLSEPDAATVVWNRACVTTWPPSPDAGDREGDTRLAFMIMFDSLALGDGLLAAMGNLGSDGTRTAMAAFRWLNRSDLADIIERGWASFVPRGAEWSQGTDLELDILDIEAMDEAQCERYGRKVEALDLSYCEAADSLSWTFDEYYWRHPDEFAPVG
jgi:hypothetical protein